MTLRPPRFSEWVLHRVVTIADRDALAGDLYEEFGARVARDGPRQARQWYRRQVRRSLIHLLGDRLGRARDGRRLMGIRSRGAGLPGRDALHDLRLAIRTLRATPGFTVVTLVVLTLGIGATTAIFSVVDGVVLRGLPFPGDDRLVTLSEPSKNGGGNWASVPEFHDWRAAQTTFEDLAAWQGGGHSPFVLRGPDSVQNLRVIAVTPSLFQVLQATPALGRLFTESDAVRGHEQVAILSDAFWCRHFGAASQVVGRTLALDNGVWTIVGVMPPTFMYPAALRTPMDMWVPFAMDAADFLRGPSRSLNAQVIGRLKDGVSLDQARADIGRITAGLRQENPRWFRNLGVQVVSLQESIVGRVKSWMVLLLAAVTFVLLIACVNVANLLLARATARAHDVAVRTALGASRWRVLRGLLAESLVLSVTGTLLGLVFAVWAVHFLRASLPPSLPRLDQVAVNYRVLFAAAVIAVVVALGVTPIWQTHPTVSLHDSGRSSAAGAPRLGIRSVLLGAEVALAVILLVGAGLFMSSFIRVIDVDLGFTTSHVLSVDLSPHSGESDAALARAGTTAAAALEQIRRLPGVEAAAGVSGTPPLLLGDDRVGITVPGRPPFDDPADYADDKLITPAYFSVLRVPILRGRFFMDADAQPGAPEVVLLNDIAARRYFGGTDPVGAEILLGSDSRTVVGVVRSVRLEGPEAELRPEVYTPLDWQHFHGSPILTLVLRTSTSSSDLVPLVRAAIRSAAPNLPAPNMQTYDQLFDTFVAQRRFNMIVLLLFGGLGIAIAGVGIYGVMTYIVEQRTAEIGVRMALGADPAQVIRMVLARAVVTTGLGLLVGLTAGWILSRFLQAFLFHMSAHDPIVFAAVSTLLAIVALIAAFVPARRAARVDPVIALRAQ